jgi:Fungalysin metallopeptidase (M36)/Bacterial pre-peptidase C-terminal domain/Fungalysin/Thermolysin Propeptide Motif
LKYVVFVSSVIAITFTSPGWAQVPNFDIREQQSTIASAEHIRASALAENRKASLVSFASSPEQVRQGTRVVPNEYGLPKLYLRDGRPLTGPSGIKPSAAAKDFLQAQPELFGLNSAEIDRLRLIVDDVTNDAKFLTFNQTVGGIDVFNGQIKFTLNKSGEIIQVATGDVIPGLDISTTPRLTPDEAVKAASAGIGNPSTGAISRTPELTIFPMTAASARLAFRIFIEVDAKAWYEILVDAETGSLLFRHNLYVHAAQGRVWTESPVKGTRTLVTFPDSWLPASATQTTGNNVDAYLDANGDEIPDPVTNANMKEGRAFSATQTFDFEFGDGTVQRDPRLYQPSAVTNIFYFVNTAHDYFYNLGFNEAAGNFQTSNFDRGGVGNDAVQAEAQSGRDDAAFAPTPEGTAPKLQMGLFTRGTSSRTDDLDSDYEGIVAVHEYGHGVTSRLVGRKTSTSCLDNIQSGALGEGWSDYFSSSLFNNPIQGAYLSQNPGGIRRYSYEGYPLTYEDIGNGVNGYEVHDDGEIWAGTLWDLRKTLGAATTDQIVLDGVKSTPCNPSMTDARDAILSGDMARNNGANRTAIWTIFAKHGMGYSAVGVDGSLQKGTRYDAGYDLPPDLQPNRGPGITSNPLSVRTGLGDQYAYSMAVSNPQSGVLNYVLSSGPANMSINSSSGAITWTASFISPRVKITVTDGKGGKVVHGYLLPIVTTLADSKAITIAGGTNSVGNARIIVPAGLPVLQFKLRGGSGDADILIEEPDGFPSASFQDGNTETLSFANPKPGEWLITVLGYQSYAGASLAAAFITPTPVPPNTSLSGLSGDFTSETFYRVSVPAGTTTLQVSTSGGNGDVDVALRKGSPAVCQPFDVVIADCLYDKASGNDGNAESITIDNPSAGDWYIDLVGFVAYDGLRLDVSSTGAPLAPPLSLTGTGSATTSTSGVGPTVSAGYATTTVSSGVAPYATAVFSLTQNGYVVSEAGVPASPPVQGARIFIDYRTGVSSGNGRIDINTGLAIANLGTNTASITYTLRDRSGLTLTTGHGTLLANEHRSRFIHELQSIAPDFNLPPNFSTAILYGSLEISSSQPVSVLGLRLTANQRGETLLTSTSVADLSRTPTSAAIYFPQIADGGGYTTTVILSNTSSAIQAGTISILDDNGNPLTVRSMTGTVDSNFSYSIPVNGSFVFQTDGSPAQSRAGWAKVTPSSGNTTPVGAGVFSFTPAGILVTESGIPSAVTSSRARLYIDKSSGHDTGLAIGNPGSTPISVTIQAFQSNGSSAGSGPATITVPANGHKSAFIGQLIDGLPSGLTGIAEITSSAPFAPITLRSLTNGRGDFLLTTFPAPDVSQPAPIPIVFPQIADGGGYSTQFIFISANGAASVTVSFTGDDGSPLPIARTQ